MDWHSVDFDWNRLRAFLVTAEEGSLSAAARALGSTQPTMGRQVAALEEELGVTLFERGGGRLELTDSGLDLLAHARRMGEAAMGVSLAAAGRSEEVAGEVTITASEAISAFLLPPVVARLRREHPGIQLNLVASNDVRDLHRREADIAIRNVRPSSPDFYARRVADSSGGFYGTPAYVEQVGPLQTMDDLKRATVLAFDNRETMVDALRAAGADVGLEQFPISTANHLVQWQLCRQGVGLCIIMAQIGDPDPAVVRVIPAFDMQIETWITCHRELRTSRRLRIVFDALVEALG